MFSAEAVASIRELSNLQTLWLGHYGYDMGHCNRRALHCARIDLSGLVQLHCVALQYVVVPDFSLPSQCRMHQVGSPSSVLDVDVWMKAASQGLLQSIHIARGGFLEKYRNVSFRDIPDLLTLLRCRSLNWQGLKCLGDEGGPVIFDPACFQCLTHLKLEGLSIYITLPGSLRLQEIHVIAPRLSIVCVNPLAFAQGLSRLKILYETLERCNLPEVLTTLSSLGKTVRSVEVSFDGDWDPEWNEFNEDRGVEIYTSRKTLVTISVDWLGRRCMCGACHECLHTTHAEAGTY